MFEQPLPQIPAELDNMGEATIGVAILTAITEPHEALENLIHQVNIKRNKLRHVSPKERETIEAFLTEASGVVRIGVHRLIRQSRTPNL